MFTDRYDPELQEEMALIARLHLPREEAEAYKKYSKKTVYQTGEYLIQSGSEERFALFLQVLRPNKSVCKKLLELCDQQKKPELATLLKMQNS